MPLIGVRGLDDFQAIETGVEGRAAAFAGGAMVSDAGALLPGAAGRAVGPIGRCAARFIATKRRSNVNRAPWWAGGCWALRRAART